MSKALRTKRNKKIIRLTSNSFFSIKRQDIWRFRDYFVCYVWINECIGKNLRDWYKIGSYIRWFIKAQPPDEHQSINAKTIISRMPLLKI